MKPTDLNCSVERIKYLIGHIFKCEDEIKEIIKTQKIMLLDTLNSLKGDLFVKISGKEYRVEMVKCITFHDEKFIYVAELVCGDGYKLFSHYCQVDRIYQHSGIKLREHLNLL